jgi:hypothetical protein
MAVVIILYTMRSKSSMVHSITIWVLLAYFQELFDYFLGGHTPASNNFITSNYRIAKAMWIIT